MDVEIKNEVSVENALRKVVAEYKTAVIESLNKKESNPNNISRNSLFYNTKDTIKSIMDRKKFKRENNLYAADKVMKSVLFQISKKTNKNIIESYSNNLSTIWADFTNKNKDNTNGYLSLLEQSKDIALATHAQLVENNFTSLEAIKIIDKATRSIGKKIESFRNGTTHEKLGYTVLVLDTFDEIER